MSETKAVNMLGRSLSIKMQIHLLGDTGDGPLGTLTGDIYRLLEDARNANNKEAYQLLRYVHERICRARHEISGDEIRELPPRPQLSKVKAS